MTIKTETKTMTMKIKTETMTMTIKTKTTSPRVWLSLDDSRRFGGDSLIIRQSRAN